MAGTIANSSDVVQRYGVPGNPMAPLWPSESDGESVTVVWGERSDFPRAT
jgi:hypothetical protein